MRIALMECELTHLLLREPYVVEITLRQLLQTLLDLRCREPEVLAVPVVELDRKLSNRRVATLLDVRKDALNRVADLRLVLRPQDGIAAALQMFRHRFLRKVT